jgi:heparinase II/III-like protein
MTGVAAGVTPRPVFCAIEHLHRDVGLARDMCAGRFTHAGVTIEAPSPRWIELAVHSDPEWWIQWSSFSYGLDLAFAFVTTGEDRFLRTWERLLRSWIEQTPIELGPTDAIARRVENWVYAWNVFRRSPAFVADADFERLVIESAAAQTEYLHSHLARERNDRTLELHALFVVALALPESDPDGERLNFAWRELFKSLISDFRADGVHREHSTHYHLVALRSFLAARENARLFELAVPATYDIRLARALEFAMFCQRPDGSIPALSDSDVADSRDILTLAADLLDRPDLRCAATNGRSGVAPVMTSADFPDGGYYVQRGSWLETTPERQRHLIFDCGTIGDGFHGHYDVLSIDVWAGRPLVVDPGRFSNVEGTPNWRQWFKGTAAHNTVCIDRLDQMIFSPGTPWSEPVTGRLLTRLAGPSLDIVGGKAVSPRYSAVHQRHVFFIAEDYWIVLDELTAEEPHDYDLRFHLAPDATGRTLVQDSRVSAPGVELVFEGPGEITIEKGWVAPEYGVKHPAPVVSLRAGRRRAVRFVTAIIPTDVRKSPVPSVLTAASRFAGPLNVMLIGSDPDGRWVDRLTWKKGGTPFAVPGLTGIAEAIWTRTNEAGAVTNLSICGLQLPADERGRQPRRRVGRPEPPRPTRAGRRRS